MALLSRLQEALDRKAPAEPTSAPITTADEKKETAVDDAVPVVGPDGSQSDQPQGHEDLQNGVKKVEAVTQAWSKWSLIAVFLNIWFLYFVYAFQYAILTSLVPFVTSEFYSHSLLNVIYIVANAMTAAVFIPLAKILDVWGRAEGYAIMVAFSTLGLILMAACKDLPTFCAAHVFYQLGFRGMIFSVDVITADASQLKNRGLAYAFTASPFIITAFAGPKAGEDAYNYLSWRWGFGAFAIIVPIVALPLYFVLKFNTKKARDLGILGHEKSDRTILQSIWYYTVEFDALGVFLFSSGFTIFLLPFTLAASAPNGWSTGYIIAMIVVGFVLLAIFVVYEWKFAPAPMLDFGLITDRTVIGTCILGAVYQVSYYCWFYYFSSFLQVVNNVTIAQAGYINNTFSVVSGVLIFAVGFLIRGTGRFKWLLYIGLPLYVLALGLMIYFRRPDQSVGFLIMCEVFISIGGAIFIIIQQVAVQAAVDHQHVAAVLSLLFVVGQIGGAIGATVSGTIWTNTFYHALSRYLPETAIGDIDTIYADLTTQLSYEWGSPERYGIQLAYGYAQTRMLAAGTAVMVLAFACVILIRNIDVKKIQQVKGTVF